MADKGASVPQRAFPQKCSSCSEEHVFKSPEQERSHNLEYHCVSFLVRVKNNLGSEQSITVRQVDGAYPCPVCQELFYTKTTCRRHLLDSCGANSEVEQVLPPVTIPEALRIPASSSPGTGTVAPAPDHDLAVFSACHVESESADEKCKTLCIVEALKLRPFSLRDQLGIERYALAHTAVVDRLARGQAAVYATNLPPRKRRLEEAKVCVACSPSVPPGLEQLLVVSPYASTLLTRTFLELEDPMCELLNEDWSFQPQLQYACAQVLAGSIFFNTRNGQAVINNTVEVYGRRQSVDAHRERFSAKKGVASQTSLPPATQTRYKDIWPLTLPNSDGERLLLGTHSFNALVTSSLRLDSRVPASVGGSTSSFRLSNPQDSAATRIYLDKESIEAGLCIAGNKDASFISVRNKVDQLRQLRSKFHDGSTYRLCRASGFLTIRHTCSPYTIFTLADFDQSHSRDGQAASTLFRDIAKNVLCLGSMAVLRLDAVQTLRALCSTSGNVGKIFDKILECFPAGQKEIPIIGNVVLNAELKDLAQILSSYITTANNSVIVLVEECFADQA